jgi:hypothetical protein
LMDLLGICGQTVRLPLVSGTESLKQRIKEAAVLV